MRQRDGMEPFTTEQDWVCQRRGAGGARRCIAPPWRPILIAITTGQQGYTVDGSDTTTASVTINLATRRTTRIGTCLGNDGTARTLTIQGNLTNNGAITLGVGGTTSPTMGLQFSGSGRLWVGSGDISAPKCKLQVNTGATLDISGLTSPLKFRSSGTISCTINGTLITGTQVINGNGNGTLAFNFGPASGLITANPNGVWNSTIGTFNTPTAPNLSPGTSFTFNGTTAQITKGMTNSVNSLIINNSAGVTLSAATTVTNVLTLTAGTLTTTTANLLTVTNTGSISGGSATAYVSGPLAQVYGAAGSKTFPVGLNNNYRAVGVNITTLSGTPTITVTPHEPSVFGGTAPAGYSVWTTRDWTVASSVSSGNVCDLTVDGTDFAPDGAATLLDYDGNATTALTTTFSSPNYSATGIALTASSDFALGCSAPTAPTISSVSAPVCSPISVNWGAVSGAASYNVYRKLSGGSYGAALASGLTGTSYDDSTAASGNTYVYAVTAVAPCGAESVKSTDSDPVAPSGAPLTPVISSVTTGCGLLTVNWGTVSGDTGGYNIYRKLSGGSYGAALANVSSGTGTYADSTANDPTKTYVYAVTAVGTCESVKSADSTGASPTNAGITASPANATTVAGFPATFTVVALNATGYQWQVNKGSGFADTVEGVDGTGGTTASFTTVAPTTAMNGYQYQCVVTGCLGPVTSAAATLSLGTYFRSAASGNYQDSTKWQISADGSTGWVAAPAGAFPGAANSVQIRATHTITNADNSTNYAATVTVDSGGTIYMNSQGSVTSSAGTWLWIGGNLVNNGTITGASPSSGNQNYIMFTGNGSWTGSTSAGDISGSKMDVWVNTGAALTLGCDIKLRANTSKANVRIYGTLNAGIHTITQASGSSSSVFSLSAGATLETANAGGIGGMGASSGTWQAVGGSMSLSPLANYVFDGTTAQSAGSGFPATLNSLTINNTGGAGANTVTLPAVAISGTLYIQNGLLSFGSTITSTAGALTFDGATYQATGTWGNTGSGAANTDATRFADSGYVTVAGPVAVSSSTQFRTRVTGDWNVAGTWEASADSGASWSSLITGFTPGSTPGSTHTVLVRSGNTVLLTEAEACGPLTVESGGTLNVSTQAFTLASAPTLSGALRMTVDKTAPNTFTGALVTQSAGTLTYGGTLTVSATGLALTNGDVLPLFSAPAYGGGFTSVTGPATPAGFAPNVSQLTISPATGGSIIITCDSTLAVTVASQVNVTCNGGGDGSITANAATGGSGSGYTYSIDGVNYQAGLAFGSLTAGSYTLTAKDSNGCVSTGVPVTITQPPVVVTSAITGPSTVNANQAGVHYSVALTSGSSYAWTVPAGASITSGSSGPNNNEIVVTFGTSGGSVGVVETSAAGCVGGPVSLAVAVQSQLPVTITGILGTTLSYTGGAGANFVLLASPSVEVCDGQPGRGWTPTPPPRERSRSRRSDPQRSCSTAFRANSRLLG